MSGSFLANEFGQVLWAKRIGHNAWQFPQGGIQFGETPEQALYRELREEVGLLPEHVQIVAQTKRLAALSFAARVHSLGFRSGMYWSKTEVVFTQADSVPHIIFS